MRNTWVPPSAPDPEALLPRLTSKQSGLHRLSSKLQTSATLHLPPPVRVTVPWGSPLGFSHLWGARLWLKAVQAPRGPKKGVNCAWLSCKSLPSGRLKAWGSNSGFQWSCWGASTMSAKVQGYCNPTGCFMAHH